MKMAQVGEQKKAEPGRMAQFFNRHPGIKSGATVVFGSAALFATTPIFTGCESRIDSKKEQIPNAEASFETNAVRIKVSEKKLSLNILEEIREREFSVNHIKMPKVISADKMEILEKAADSLALMNNIKDKNNVPADAKIVAPIEFKAVLWEKLVIEEYNQNNMQNLDGSKPKKTPHKNKFSRYQRDYKDRESGLDLNAQVSEMKKQLERQTIEIRGLKEAVQKLQEQINEQNKQ